jgi:hypothetical protein
MSHRTSPYAAVYGHSAGTATGWVAGPTPQSIEGTSHRDQARTSRTAETTPTRSAAEHGVGAARRAAVLEPGLKAD